MKRSFILYFFITFTILFAAEQTTLNLTEEENLWIKKNPVVKVAMMSYWPKNKQGSNIHYGLIDLINKYANINIVPIVFNSWESGYKQVLKGKNINGIMGLSWSKERENSFIYTPAYDFTPCYLITREDEIMVKSFIDLKNKTVYLKENSITHNIINETSKSTKYIDLKNLNIMYNKLSKSKEADAILSYFIDLQEMEKNNLKIVDTIYDKYGEVSIGINKKYPELASIINKTYQIIPKDELSALRDNNGLKLNKKEKEWLQTKTIVKYLYSNHMKPLEWSNELGEHTGIISDLIKLIGEKSNIKFEAISSKNQEDAVQKIKNNQAIMYSAAGVTEENKKYLNFTTKILHSTPYVFITKKDLDIIDGFNSAVGKKIGVAKGYPIYDLVTQINPNLKLTLIENIQEGVEKLNDGELDILIINGTSARYYVNHSDFPNLHIAYKTIFNLDLKIAISKDFPQEIISIIDKSINLISQKELSDITHRWTQTRIEPKTDWILIGKVTAGICILLIIIFINNLKLKLEVYKFQQ